MDTANKVSNFIKISQSRIFKFYLDIWGQQ
jgi:hypothetical protein